ncbi:MAG: TRAP transporter small permease [Lachnospiraceae bacterium]|nr:TRAP transporter small permease [Lachnospiraceae bacterium]
MSEEKQEKKSLLATLEENLMVIPATLAAAFTLVGFILGLLGEGMAESAALANQFGFYACTWVVCFAMPYCVRDNAHLRVDVFSKMYSPSVSRVVDLINEILGLLICIGMFIGSFLLLKSTIGLPAEEAVGVPLTVTYLAPVIGFAISIVRSVQRFIAGGK